MRFEGQADLSTPVTDVSFENQEYDADTNLTTLDVIMSDSTGEWLSIYFTNTSGGIQNAQLMSYFCG